GTTFNQK
nr:aminopeptidase B [Saccharomyces cerevisiae, Peptide Partial, 7 aa] [Saccharomyces cerevisiae]